MSVQSIFKCLEPMSFKNMDSVLSCNLAHITTGLGEIKLPGSRQVKWGHQTVVILFDISSFWRSSLALLKDLFGVFFRA